MSVINEKGKKYKFKVNSLYYETEKKILTGKEILEISGYMQVENYKLYMITKRISLYEIVDLSSSELNMFYTTLIIPKVEY